MYLVYCMEIRGHRISYVCIENVCTNNVFVCAVVYNVCVCYVYIFKMSKKKKKKKKKKKPETTLRLYYTLLIRSSAQ
jgi:hypothetical protein